MIGLEIAALVCLAFWVGLALDRSRAWPRESVLPKAAEQSRGHPTSSVCAVVPARNEAIALARTLPSLLNQESIDLVVVADDSSDDATPEVVHRLAEASERGEALRWVEVPALPTGWSGKVHAIAYATAWLLESESGRMALESGWWLFSDADIEHDSSTVRDLMARAESEEQGGPFDLVSVMARLHAGSFWERLLIPPFVFFFQLLYPFGRVRDPRSSVAAAAGGCVLVRRSAYETAGGHTAMRDALIDDVELARLIKASGGRIWLGLDEDIRSIRAYRRLGELWQMVARSAYVQLRYRVDLLCLVILGLAIVVVAPPLLIGAAGVQAAIGSAPAAISLRTLTWASLAWLLQARALLPSVRHHRVPAVYCLTLPVAGGLYALMTLSSAWSHFSGRGSRWRGRSYPFPGGGDSGS
jgi:hopene-associated glycosyltransferase HpnB